MINSVNTSIDRKSSHTIIFSWHEDTQVEIRSSCQAEIPEQNRSQYDTSTLSFDSTNINGESDRKAAVEMGKNTTILSDSTEAS